MFIMTDKTKQTGTALVFSLMLLIILTLLGISSMNNTLMQERMAANARMQTEVFEAASAGVTSSVRFVTNDSNWPADHDQCGQFGDSSIDTEFLWGPTEWKTVSDPESDITLEQRMYCLQDSAEPETFKSQLFVLSRGSFEADGGIQTSREIEVRIGRRQLGGVSPGALDFNELTLANVPTSGSLVVEGEAAGDCGPAVLTDSPEARDLFIGNLSKNEKKETKKLKNYAGGIEAGPSGDPWDDPAALQTFITDIRDALPENLDSENPTGGYRHEGDFTGRQGKIGDSGSGEFGTPGDLDEFGNFIPGTGAPKLTYFGGDVEFSGNFEGAGLLIVEGNLSWSGTPSFDGMIVVLGGSVNVGGGGKGGNFSGSLYVNNLDLESETPEFGDVSIDWRGGGNETFRAQCSALVDFADRLLDLNENFPEPDSTNFNLLQEARNAWVINCTCEPITSGNEDLIVKSWRENIGWRDDGFLGSDGG